MGQKCAPVFTTLVIAYLEKKLYKKVEELYKHRNGQYIKRNWKRFLDYCFLPWKATIGPVEKFRDNILNSLDIHHEKVRYQHRFFRCRNFKKLGLKIYNRHIPHKPTDSINYITFVLGHPRHTKVNIPFNMAKRIRTIVSDEERSKQKLQDLKTILERKNYP